MLDVLSALSDDRLRRAFGADTLARAQVYAADHAVDQLAVLDADPLSFEARATVQGTRRRPYFTRVVLDATHYRTEVYSVCTCPVGGQCKHGAAVALVARAALDRGRSNAWEREVSDLLDELDTLVPEGAADQPLALELGLAPAAPRTMVSVRGRGPALVASDAARSARRLGQVRGAVARAARGPHPAPLRAGAAAGRA